jgi:hypothetical protein
LKFFSNLSVHFTVVILLSFLAILASVQIAEGKKHFLKNSPLKPLIDLLKPLIVILLPLVKILAPLIKVLMPVLKLLAIPILIPILLVVKAANEL